MVDKQCEKGSINQSTLINKLLKLSHNFHIGIFNHPSAGNYRLALKNSFIRDAHSSASTPSTTMVFG